MAHVVRRTIAAWWRELIPLALLNAAWLVTLAPAALLVLADALVLALIVVAFTVAPATAAFYVVAGDVAEGDSAGWRAYSQAARRHFWPAVRWGLLQAVVYFVGAFNLTYYGANTGLLWDTLRVAWVLVLAAWTVVQMLYWPLLLEAENQGIVNTLRNALVMLALNPAFVLAVALLTVVIVVVSVVTGVLVGLVMMPLVTLLGTFAVRDRLQVFRSRASK